LTWLLRVLTWDGLLPVVVWAIPLIVAKSALPISEPAIVLLASLLPIAALIVRFFVGHRMIQANACGTGFRRVQVTCLCVGLFVLMLLDCLLITLFSLEFGGGPGVPEEEWLAQVVIIAIFYLPYLALLSVAMYPGRAPQPALVGEFTRRDQLMDDRFPGRSAS